jgi:hypothetical protein
MTMEEDLVAARTRLWNRVQELEAQIDQLRLENAHLRYLAGLGEEP